MLTLDNGDPRTAALGIDVGPEVRLVHPFHHGGGEPIAYRHRGGAAIEFVGSVEAVEQPWPPGGIPETFPTRAIETAAIEGEPRREFGERSVVHLGGEAPAARKYGREADEAEQESEGGCAACPTGVPWLIASVPSRPVPELNI